MKNIRTAHIWFLFCMLSLQFIEFIDLKDFGWWLSSFPEHEFGGPQTELASVLQPQTQNCITHILSEEASSVAFRVKIVVAGVRMAIWDSKTWNQVDVSKLKSHAAAYSGNHSCQMCRRGKREALWYLRISFKNQANQATRRKSTFISVR